MTSDAALAYFADQYLESEFSSPQCGVPFDRYLAFEEARPTHRSHREEEGRSTDNRVAVAIRRTAGRNRLR